jgi:hypothetical protein
MWKKMQQFNNISFRSFIVPHYFQQHFNNTFLVTFEHHFQ